MTHDEMVRQIAAHCDAHIPDSMMAVGVTQLIVGIVNEHIAALEAEVEALRVHEHEWSEAHAMLTGKFEIGYAMTHPEGAHTELGKAAGSLNIKVDTLEADLAATRTEIESLTTDRDEWRRKWCECDMALSKMQKY